jgi:hypothetical protein
MKNHHAIQAVVATVALFAAATSSLTQNAAPPTQSTAQASTPSVRSLTDYAPVLKSTMDRAWAIDPRKGVDTRKVGDGVYVVTDGVWQSAFAVTDAGVVVFDAPET